MNDKPTLPERKRLRLPTFDYSSQGGYYVTICTHGRLPILANIADGQSVLTDEGRIVSESWSKLPSKYPIVIIDEFVIMPNHIHGILFLQPSDELTCRGGLRSSATRPLADMSVPCNPAIVSLSEVIRYFKTTTAKQINILRDTRGQPVWQRNYYEHIIRNEGDLQNIRRYIDDNPAQWAYDQENPDSSPTGGLRKTLTRPYGNR
jgi:putative transposase